MGRTAPIRVVLVADAVGGVWDVTLSLASGLLASDGAAVLLVCVGPPPDAARLAAAQAIPGLTLEVLGGHLEWMEGGRDWLETLRHETARRAAAWNADLVQVNAGSAGTGLAGVGDEAPLRARSPRPPVVLGVHGDVAIWWLWVMDGGALPGTVAAYLHWQRELARQALRRADAVVCPSAFLANELVRCYRLARRPSVIPNAVLPLPEPDGPICREPDLAAVVGRAWDEAKNVALVAKARHACRRPWRVEVAGDLAEPGRLPAVPPGAPGLSYLGFVNKRGLSRLFHRATVYVASSSYEPFGLSPVEAALAGCAVVANDIPAFREVWGDAAAYFARNDAGALAALLDDLYDQPARVAALAAAAGRRAAQRYTMDRMVGAYRALYTRLLARRGRCLLQPAAGAPPAMSPAVRRPDLLPAHLPSPGPSLAATTRPQAAPAGHEGGL